jgi:hypothetical protein
MSSFTRSIGAAAVFETAADTPPTEEYKISGFVSSLSFRPSDSDVAVPFYVLHPMLMANYERSNVLKKSTTKPYPSWRVSHARQHYHQAPKTRTATMNPRLNLALVKT